MTSFDTPQPSNQDDAEGTQRPFFKGGAALGLTAGLVGGSLAGLAFGVPGISSAASADVAVSPAAIVQQTDDTDTDTDTETDTDTDSGETDTVPADDVPAEVGDRLREVLQQLVDDGTLTADQADAVTTHLIENRPERGDRFGRWGDRGGRRGPGGFDRSGVITDLLGIDAQTLRDELRSGSTLAEIAEANGVETSALIDTIVEQASEQIDAAVENERLTADEAAEKLAEFEAQVTERINGN